MTPSSSLAPLREHIAAIRLIDTHEHLMEEAGRLRTRLDFGTLLSMYAWDDFVSAGMPRDDMAFVSAECGDPAEKWRRLAPWWPAVRHTGYLRAYRLAMERLYGIGDLGSEADAVELSRRIAAANTPGVVGRILRDGAGIERAIVNSLEPEEIFRAETDASLFLHDIGFGLLFSPDRFPRLGLERETGIAVGDLDALLRAVDWYFEHRGPHSAGVKSQSAYSRTLFFGDPPPRAEAARAFARFLAEGAATPRADLFAFQNFLMHHIAARCADFNLPLRLHTGYLAGVDRMDLPSVSPVHLNNMLLRYGRCRFVFFHIGYPWQDELLALAKAFSNAWVDLCWTWIIDPLATRRFLRQYALAAPWNKIFGFGGDYIHADCVVGHAAMAREGAALALAPLVDEGALTLDEAREFADRIFRQNAKDFFRLER